MRNDSRAAVEFTFKERFQIGASLIPPFALLWIATRAGWLHAPAVLCLAAMPAAVILGMLLPRVFAGWHRVFSAAQRWVGNRLLRVLLAIVFLLTILPIGLWLRLRGRSFLEHASADSYWTPARPPGSLKNQY
jgi:hypothetical protein